MGDEPYYIDIVSNFIEKKVLSEEEKGFNQTVLYGMLLKILSLQLNAIQ
jgi:DNA polymerase-3 subunit delta